MNNIQKQNIGIVLFFSSVRVRACGGGDEVYDVQIAMCTCHTIYVVVEGDE